MPRWKALPDELDPQVREFAVQLRRLIDRGGLSVAAVADRTGCSKTSWERYLNGRLLAPKGAIVALAEVTGTDQAHLATMWELAERAWSRSEMRHDLTMEGIRVAQARAALGEFGPDPLGDDRSRRFGGRTTGTAVDEGEGAGAGGGGRLPSVPIQRGDTPRVPQPEDRRSAEASSRCGTAGRAARRGPASPMPSGGTRYGSPRAAPRGRTARSMPTRTCTPQWSQ